MTSDDANIKMTEVRLGPGGVPDWLGRNIRFCSRCGTELRFGPVAGEDRERLTCSGCGFVFYINPRLVVGTLPITPDGKVILIRRGIEPGYGMWAQPGGFLEIDETAAQGAVRETLEETGYVVELGPLVGLYSRVVAAIVTAIYEARVVGGEPLTSHETLEVRAFDPEEIPWHELAFETSIKGLRDWAARVRPELRTPDPADHPRDFGA
jgi:ADP-ribose pyrophosphatase YjhB (NUDIX family)